MRKWRMSIVCIGWIVSKISKVSFLCSPSADDPLWFDRLPIVCIASIVCQIVSIKTLSPMGIKVIRTLYRRCRRATLAFSSAWGSLLSSVISNSCAPSTRPP
ncbi:hypothetical protein [Chamaesiphon sp. OTE_20_metabat_361]|uniref:hypothetical protein n=1 Tax=Chamaesiphon sp. OTE_20_metabat_361 TaxID=2964689 RepID=UPI00286C138A|nr:hypothetical protein [Chamaesiphon sp. OTE_20_metabat_361]